MTATEDPYGNPYQCEARKPGGKSFLFGTPDEDSARAMCDVHEWEFIRCFAPGSHADKPKATPQKGDPPLTGKQIRCLVTEARFTFDALSNMGNIADTFDSWRHDVVYQTVRREGLTQCQNSHYRKLLSVFRQMRGAADKGGMPQNRKQSREGGDTSERREQLLALIAHELGKHAQRVENPQNEAEVKLAAHASSKGGVINEAYLLAIAKAKNAGTMIYDVGCLIKLTSARLEELLFTLRNRIASREGRGTTKGRNKKQGRGDA